MKKFRNGAAYLLAAIPLLLIGQCVYNEVSQQSELNTLCSMAKVGGPIKTFWDDAARTTFKLRAGGPTGKDENEWFDRQYLRLGAWLKQTKTRSDDYTVVFAKPGIGYYACIVLHEDGLVTSAWFEDRSS